MTSFIVSSLLLSAASVSAFVPTAPTSRSGLKSLNAYDAKTMPGNTGPLGKLIVRLRMMLEIGLGSGYISY